MIQCHVVKAPLDFLILAFLFSAAPPSNNAHYTAWIHALLYLLYWISVERKWSKRLWVYLSAFPWSY